MFDSVGEWLTQARTLGALAFLAVIACLAAYTAWKTKSTPATIGVLLGGALALAILVQLDTLAFKIGGEIDGTQKTEVETGNFDVLKEFGG